MTIIAIKDLPENIDLDRQAMQAIAGGSRTGLRQNFRRQTMFPGTRIVDYPAGKADASGRRAASKPPE